ncbi:alpha/beta hydrolase [Actinomadura madurae]|nr:alpha/beta hydrolase [Actinomadura madurae]MCQ0015301.1 alpha/beta hydrolase [Actinomadura madurae]
MLTTPAVMRMDVMDPELDAFLPFIPKADLTDPVAARKQLAELAAAAPSEVTAAAAPGTEGMEVEDRTVPAAPEVPVRIYRPSGAHGAIIWLRGGGWVVGDLDTEHPTAARLAGASGAVVISVDYRQAPEHRFPAALDDVYAVLEWTTQNAADLGIAPDRIAVGGHSARRGPRGRGGAEGARRGGAADPLPTAQPARAGRPAGDVVAAQLHRHPLAGPRQPHHGMAALPGRRSRDPVRRSCPRRRPVRPATGVRVGRGVRPAPRRGHRLRAAPAPGGRHGRTAPVARDVPRLARDPVRRVATADRRTRRHPTPRPGRVRRPASDVRGGGGRW